LIITNERSGLLLIRIQPVSNGFFLIVFALIKGPATPITNPFFLGWMEGDVEHGPTTLACPSSGKPAHQFLGIHFNVYHVVDDHPDFREDRSEGLGLGDRPRKSIENKPLPAVGGLSRSSMIPMTRSSGTSCPRSIKAFAFIPKGVFSFTAALRISPVEIWGI
jgi:hypothetical protein